MYDPQKDRGSSIKTISSYRKRQERVEKLLPVFWIGVMVLIVGAGYLIYRITKPAAPLALNATETLTPTRTVPPTTAAPATAAQLATEPAPQAATLAASETPAEPGVITYTVKQGDTLASISAQLGVNVPTLEALNPKVTPEFIDVGDELVVPALGTSLASVTPASSGDQNYVEYKVVSGDTLAAIAARFGTTVDAIVQANSLASADQIQEGQTLRIPVAPGTTFPGTPSPTVTPSP